MQTTHSQFQVFSMGIAAENKHLESDILHVNPIEVTTMGDGELDARLVEYEGSGTDKNGDSYELKVKQNSAVEAKWLRLGHTNRRTPPDVRRGERVLLYRHGDSGEMYWDTMGMDDHLRRLETVIYSWSDVPEEEKDATEPANSYSFEVCTHTQQATFRTVKGNKEPFFYTFQFNTKEGVVLLTDDVGNYFELNSKLSYVKLHNKNGATTVLDNDNTHSYSPDSIAIKAEKDVSFKCRRFSIEAGNNINIHAAQHITQNAGDTITHHSDRHNMYYNELSATDNHGNGIQSSRTEEKGHVEVTNQDKSQVILDGNKCEVSTPSYRNKSVSMESKMKDESQLWYTFGEPMDVAMNELRETHEDAFGGSKSNLYEMNRLHIDGDLNLVELVNVDGCRVELRDENILIDAPNNFELKTGTDVTITVGQNFTQTVGGDYLLDVTGKATIKAAGGLSLESGGDFLKIGGGLRSSGDISGITHPE